MIADRNPGHVSILLLFCLSGCGSTYVDPTSGGTARVRILAPTVSFTESARVVFYPDGKCQSAAEFGLLGGNLSAMREKNLTMLGMPTVLPIGAGKAFERRVPAGERVLFHADSRKGQDLCTAHASFVPRVDGDYEILLRSTSHHCGLDVRKIGTDATGTAFAVKPTDVTFPKECDKRHVSGGT